MGNLFTTFTNCRQIINGQLVDGERLVVSQDTGRILKSTGYIGGEIVDLDDRIVAPGFLELHTNGVIGVHYSNYKSEDEYIKGLEKVARWYPTHGITGFWATVPSVDKKLYKDILPLLEPREWTEGASLLGAHVEGPYLSPSHAGAHNPSILLDPTIPPIETYGPALGTSVKLATVADSSLCSALRSTNPHLRLSLGHTNASYGTALASLSSGITSLTHAFNAMPPLHHREPGPLGLLSLPSSHDPPPPFFGLLADGKHVHPRAAALLFNSAPDRSLIVSDSTELTGLPDGVYPGNAQIVSEQRKRDGVVVTADAQETLVGSCVVVDQCVRNVARWVGGGEEGDELDERVLGWAVRAATENVARFMGLKDRGMLEQGRRADLAVLDGRGDVTETWIAGRRVWPPEEEDEDDEYS